MLEQVIRRNCQRTGQCIGIHHLEQVHEPGIPHHPRVRPERPSADPAQDRVQQHGVQQRKPVLIRRSRPVERPMDERRGEEHNRRVRQDDAPVRENPLVEVACHESRQPARVINISHYLGFSFCQLLVVPSSPCHSEQRLPFRAASCHSERSEGIYISVIILVIPGLTGYLSK